MLDAARCIVLVSPSADRAQTGKQALIAETEPIAKARRIIELRAACSSPLLSTKRETRVKDIATRSER
jgi:hypothetical protein